MQLACTSVSTSEVAFHARGSTVFVTDSIVLEVVSATMADETNKETGVAAPPPIQSKTSSNSVPSLKSPRTPRFAEATSVDSPIDPPATGRPAFPQHDSQYLAPQAQPGDVGFGYIGQRDSVQYGQAVEMPLSARSPLKSALRSPGAPPRKIEQNPLSPTWNEEEKLEKMEASTEKEQAKDLVGASLAII